MRKITKLIVHCSDTPDDRDVSVDDIKKWHLDRGWADIGYHYVITRDGLIMSGRLVETVGAHCRGYNKESIGVCLVGRKDFAAEQFKSLNKLNSMLLNIFPEMVIHGHKEFSKTKTCPNFEVSEVIEGEYENV